MFTSWMQVKVKYTKQLDNGALKRVTEPYLLAALSFTDAEARIYEELGSIIRGEFHVVAIQRVEYHDIFAYDDSDVWYKCKISYESMDADSERTKKVTQNFLVGAHSVKEASERIKEALSTLMVDFTIKSVIESPIVDIFPFSDAEKTGVGLTELPESCVVILKNGPADEEYFWNNGKLTSVESDDDADYAEKFQNEMFLVVGKAVGEMETT